MIKIGHPYLKDKSGLYWINCIIHEDEETKKVFWGGGYKKIMQNIF